MGFAPGVFKIHPLKCSVLKVRSTLQETWPGENHEIQNIPIFRYLHITSDSKHSFHGRLCSSAAGHHEP